MNKRIICNHCQKSVIKSHWNRHKLTKKCQMIKETNEMQQEKSEMDLLKEKINQLENKISTIVTL